MKKLKNNKGITGIDIVVSITIIAIILGITLTVYNSYSKKAREVKRTSVATNLAMKVIEYIEETDIEDNTIKAITDSGIDIESGYGIESCPSGYTIKAVRKTAGEDSLINSLAFQVNVTVEYKVGNETKSITLSTIKKKNEIEEAEEPNIKGNKIYNNTGELATSEDVTVTPVKYDVAKNGYVKTNSRDSEWYSISSKDFPIVAIASESDFDRNGVIKSDRWTSIKKYVWVPFYGTTGSLTDLKYRFCDKNGKIIEYDKYDGATSYDIYNYKISDDAVVENKAGGKWVEVDYDLNSSDSDYNNLKNNIFTWE